jgi:hypothetical protein
LHFAQIPTLPDTDHGLDELESQHARAVPAAQLGEDTWLLVDAAQGAVFARRDKAQKKDPTLAEREELKRLWREAAEPMRDLAHQIATLEVELDKAVEAAWEA